MYLYMLCRFTGSIGPLIKPVILAFWGQWHTPSFIYIPLHVAAGSYGT